MTSNEYDSFVRILIDLNGRTPSWYWLMLNLSHGKLDVHDLDFSLKLSGDKSGGDADMLRQVEYFYYHQGNPDIKVCQNTARLLLPIIANNSQFKSHAEMPEIQYYKNILDFVQFIGDAKLQYDILTRVIDKLNDKMAWDRFGTSHASNDVKLTYSVARAIRSLNDYAQNPAQFIKRKSNTDNKMFEFELDYITRSVRKIRMDDLDYYMQIAGKMPDSDAVKLDIASEIIRVGWAKMGEIARVPHAHFGPNNQFDHDIAEIGNRIRASVAAAGCTPAIDRMLDKVVWPNFATSNVRKQILDGTFDPNFVPRLVAQENKKIQK